MKKIISILLMCAMGLTLMSAVPAASAASASASEGGEILASFHVIYDVHVPRDTASYEAALKNMSSINPDTSIALVIGGDNTVNTEISELDTFYGLLEANNPVSDEETVIILGNHDVRGANVNGNWVGEPDPTLNFPFWETAKARYAEYNEPYMPEYAKETLYHTKELGGYTFIALNTELGMKDQMYMSDKYLAWFEQQMKEAYEKDPTKPIFIISHQPMKDTVWRTEDRYMDAMGSVATTGLDAKVQKILEKYPTAIFISGHQHNELNQIEPILRPWASYVDVPAHYADSSRPREGGLGYEVEIYRDKVIFRAVNFAKLEWYHNYDLVIPTTDGGISAIYQTAKKQMQAMPENFDDTDKWLLDTLEGMLTKTYTQTKAREEQFYYTAEDLENICFVAEQLKTRVGPFLGDTLTFNTDKLDLKLDSTASLTAVVGENAVNGKHLVWSSSNEGVVKVVNGKLTPVAAGVAEITATSVYNGSVKAVCAVNVTDAGEPDDPDSGSKDEGYGNAPADDGGGEAKGSKGIWTTVIVAVVTAVISAGASTAVCISVMKKKKEET